MTSLVSVFSKGHCRAPPNVEPVLEPEAVVVPTTAQLAATVDEDQLGPLLYEPNETRVHSIFLVNTFSNYSLSKTLKDYVMCFLVCYYVTS